MVFNKYILISIGILCVLFFLRFSVNEHGEIVRNDSLKPIFQGILSQQNETDQAPQSEANDQRPGFWRSVQPQTEF